MNDAGSRRASSKADKAERGRRPGFRVGASGQKQSGGSLVAVRGLLMGSGRVWKEKARIRTAVRSGVWGRLRLHGLPATELARRLPPPHSPAAAAAAARYTRHVHEYATFCVGDRPKRASKKKNQNFGRSDILFCSLGLRICVFLNVGEAKPPGLECTELGMPKY